MTRELVFNFVRTTHQVDSGSLSPYHFEPCSNDMIYHHYLLLYYPKSLRWYLNNVRVISSKKSYNNACIGDANSNFYFSFFFSFYFWYFCCFLCNCNLWQYIFLYKQYSKHETIVTNHQNDTNTNYINNKFFMMSIHC